MGGFHLLDLVVILVIGLLVAGPKALQSISRNAGKGVGQAKTVKDKVMAELPMEEVSEISKTLSKIPLSPQQAIQKLLIPEKQNKRVLHPLQPQLSETRQAVKIVKKSFSGHHYPFQLEAKSQQRVMVICFFG
jgi:Sec-independent protein translocase protein TatA